VTKQKEVSLHCGSTSMSKLWVCTTSDVQAAPCRIALWVMYAE